jgi:hypothetical protein
MAVEKEMPNIVERASNADRARYALRASPSAREAKRSDDHNLSGKQSKEGTSVHTLVMALAPGTLPETVSCACNADFIVYGTTNAGVLSNTPGCGYSISVKSTGAGIGSISPTFVIGAVLATRSPFI